MSAHAVPAAGGRTLVVRGTPYPVLLPQLSDPRLHLAATIVSLQVIGQVGFHFRLSIAQILLSLVTCAVLEVAIAFRRQRVIMWPASALLTGNGVAFVLRVPGTAHGDWWSLRGWWIYVGTAAVSLLSKYVIAWRGAHVFNPSNIGLVVCFLALGRGRADPLDFWWGPMSAWLVAALVVILIGGFAILSRLRLLRIALAFWASFAAGIGVLALTGHTMLARWHLGPITGFQFWWMLVTSPEVLVFLFFMITDPKTAPRSPQARVAYAVSLGLLAAILIAPTTSEFASKVALLGSLAIVCLAMRVLAWLPLRADRRLALALVPATLAAFAAAIVLPGSSAGASAYRPLPPGTLPPITIVPSHAVQSALDLHTAELIAHDLLSSPGVVAHTGDTMRVWLEPGAGQDPPFAVAQLAGHTFRLSQAGARWTITRRPRRLPEPIRAPTGPPLSGYRLTNVAAGIGLRFRQQSFRFGVTSDPTAMMGGGVCWLDYDNDGRLDLFVVNSYTDAQYAQWQDHGGAPTTELFHNVGGKFVNVTGSSRAGLPVRGNGCVAADLDGDGYTDLFVTTATDDILLWNNGNGTFTEGARKAGIVSFGWHAGAAVADVNGDGRPDLYVAGYTNMSEPLPDSVKGFPSNYAGVRDELFLNEGHRHFKEVAAQVGLDPKPYDHSLGAEFADVNHDGRPDLYVANDEDPNKLYLNEAGGPLGFHFVNVAQAEGVADRNAGMGVAITNAGGRTTLFVTNSRGQGNAGYQSTAHGFQDVRKRFSFGPNPAGWGDSWIDLKNSGSQELVLANGEIPVTNVRKDAVRLQVLAPQHGRYVDSGLLRTVAVDGRGLAAADYDNDGRVDFAVGTVGGNLLLVHNTSPAGNWLEVSVQPFSPGATVTVVDSSGRSHTATVVSGSSYLSSEDPRVHFGFGTATVRSVTVRYPDGTVRRLSRVATNQILTVPR